jgi:purine nucleoside phosphorylase
MPLRFCRVTAAATCLSPSHINYYRAKIIVASLKRPGYSDLVLSLIAVGSLKEELAPGQFVLAIDQVINDRTFCPREIATYHRVRSIVAACVVAHPVSDAPSRALVRRGGRS